MQDLVKSAFVQDAVNRVSSYIFRKCEKKASTGHNIERLEMAHTELELALERTGKLPITDISLLRRRKILKRAFEECSDVLHRCKLQAHEDEQIEQGQTVMHSSFPKRIARATQSSITYLFTNKDGVCCSDVRRFEWLADWARKFVKDVESGCSLRHYTFCNPLLRKLLEGKTLRYERVKESQHRDIYIWPICLEERGIEAELSYQYEDYKMPWRNFHLRIMLRLSESTDIVGTAVKCLQYLASQFKLVAETATGELTLLPYLHDISHSYAPPWVGIQESYTQVTQDCRPDPICCKSNGHHTIANNIVSSELSDKFEKVIYISIQCSLHSSIDEGCRNDQVDWSPSLRLKAGFVPHGEPADLLQRYGTRILASIGDRRDGNVEQEIEMVRLKSIDCLMQQPVLTDYLTTWLYVHGLAFFQLRTPAFRRACSHELGDRSRPEEL